VRLADYDDFFAQANLEQAPITSAVFDRATAIRAAYNFKLADSLHLATAVHAGCDCFLTNDFRLSAFTDIAVEALP
jgi:predicted nucleic acid-binding protein